jgi:peptidoglycan/LPS O-acetylase OafA/YrhL
MTSSNRLSYITGLDGIRAVAVMAVLFYHANQPWALGGFLGVETFFVLSGFLITSLLLTEWQATNQINLRHFWLRRARRLLPAVWLLLLALPVLAVLFARDALPRLREDIPAALIYITNWVYIVRDVPYFEAFGGRTVLPVVAVGPVFPAPHHERQSVRIAFRHTRNDRAFHRVDGSAVFT